MCLEFNSSKMNRRFRTFRMAISILDLASESSMAMNLGNLEMLKIRFTIEWWIVLFKKTFGRNCWISINLVPINHSNYMFQYIVNGFPLILVCYPNILEPCLGPVSTINIKTPPPLSRSKVCPILHAVCSKVKKRGRWNLKKKNTFSHFALCHSSRIVIRCQKCCLLTRLICIPN